MVSTLPGKEILNLDEIESEFHRLESRKLRIGLPSLDKETVTEKTTFEDLKRSILDMAANFPHRRVVLTYKTLNEEIIIELHPVTGAA
jgi:hypothetical protein